MFFLPQNERGEMMEPRQYVRKTYYIKNSAQTTFILRFVTISLLGGILAVSAFNFLAYRKIDTVLYAMRLPKISAGGLLWHEMVYTNIFVILFTMLVFAITAKGLYTKLNGPLKKLTNDLRRMGEGNLCQTISLRENDEFREFAQDLNGMGEQLHRRFLAIRQTATLIAQKTETLAQNQEPEATRAELARAIGELNNSIGSFKV